VHLLIEEWEVSAFVPNLSLLSSGTEWSSVNDLG